MVVVMKELTRDGWLGEFRTNKIEFSTDGRKIVFEDIDNNDWVVVDIDAVMCVKED